MLSIGMMEDKPTTGLLIEEKKVGIYHATEQLSAEQAKESIDKILGDPKYKENALKFKDIYKNYDPVDKLDELIQKETKKFDEMTT